MSDNWRHDGLELHDAGFLRFVFRVSLQDVMSSFVEINYNLYTNNTNLIDYLQIFIFTAEV